MKLLIKIKTVAHEKGISTFSGTILFLLKYPFVNYLLCELASHVPNFMVPMLHRWRGVKIGRNVSIDRKVYLDNLYPELIQIEDGVRITAHCVIVCHFKVSEKLSEYMPFHKFRVSIKKNAFIGVNSTLLPGAVVGENSIVSAGSVVSGKIRDGILVGGNPARAIRSLIKDEKSLSDI